eukprot:1154889-Pelagomonas_calceolata.AAC.1
MLKVPNWRTWAYTEGRCHTKHGKQEIGASFYCPLTDSKEYVELNGAGITNTICRAELTALLLLSRTPIHTLLQKVSLLFIKFVNNLFTLRSTNNTFKEMSLKTISTLISNSQTNICIYKVKSHAGIVGNECADAIAKYQASQANNSVADTGIPGAGPGGNPLFHSFWLAKEEIRKHTASTSIASAPNPKITYLPIFKMILSFTCIQITDLDMPTPKQATTVTIRKTT